MAKWHSQEQGVVTPGLGSILGLRCVHLAVMGSRTWFVTGASAGFGRILTEKLLEQGEQVAATARRPEALADLSSRYPDNLITPQVDVTDAVQIERAVSEAIARFGRIDVLVNNAGYGVVGTVEEVSDLEARQQFDVNVFGLLNVTRPVVAHMRGNRAGLIFNISSIAGLTSGATFAIYCASKHAVEAISEGLAASVKPLGIKVVTVEPGAFRTRFHNGQSLQHAAIQINDYAELRAGTEEWLEGIDGSQPGDPAKLCDALIALADEPNPPLRLLCGQDAYDRAIQKLDALKADFDRNADLSRSMVY